MDDRWGLREYRGKKDCMYCGRPAKLRWYRGEKRTEHLCCKACGAALGYWSDVDVDWSHVKIDDVMAISVIEQRESPHRFKRRCSRPMICYCAPFEEEPSHRLDRGDRSHQAERV